MKQQSHTSVVSARPDVRRQRLSKQRISTHRGVRGLEEGSREDQQFIDVQIQYQSSDVESTILQARADQAALDPEVENASLKGDQKIYHTATTSMQSRFGTQEDSAANRN